jgi:TPR repeat protein
MNSEIDCKYYPVQTQINKSDILTFLFDFIIDKALNVDPDILAKAWDGDAISQLLLGKAYFNAVYVKDNCSNAFKWFQLSAEQENMEAQFRLADLFALGQGTPKRYTEAYEWYTKSALQGYKKALIRIFNLYQHEKTMYCRGKLNSEDDESVSPELLKKNNVRELNEYRLKYHESKLNHAIDYYTKLFSMLKYENHDDPNPSLKLGFLYQYGFGVSKCAKLAIDYYTEAAKQGNRNAQYHLGYLYENDKDFKFNYHLALRWYRSSATSGNVAAQNALGYFYEKGLATELYFEGAIYWYTKAAIAGNSDAQLTLGKLYRKGEGVVVDISQAIKWYTLAANQRSGAAQNCLNQLSRNEKKSQLSGINNNNTGYVGEHQIKLTLRSKLQDDIEKMNSSPHIKKLEKLVEHALRTDGNAMFSLGMKYYHGVDFTLDKEAGFRWIKKAAKTGLQKAELKVAEMYRDGGDEVEQDYHESTIWTAKLVKQKNSIARCNLGLLYLSGEGVRKDPLEASKWFTKSADQGNAEAQYQFGLLRLKGLGLRKDIKEALQWFNQSALHGNINALHMLGIFYLNENHYDRNVNRAMKFYEYAASNGNQDSQVILAKVYEEGKLVEQNLQKAEKHYQLAELFFDDYQRYQLAKKYMEGTFGSSNYIKAFELFKKIAVEEPSSDYNILQTPILYTDPDMDYQRLVAMLTLVAERGEQEIGYNIGYLYENGAHTDFGKILFRPSLTHALQ